MTTRAKRAADLASRHLRNAYLISRAISLHPQGSIDAYRSEMAVRAAVMAGRHFAGIALRDVTQPLPDQTLADLAETEGYVDWLFSAPDVVTLSRTLRAAEAADGLPTPSGMPARRRAPCRSKHDA
ncbi:hypothetical protein NKG99_14465 [Mesorhizobium sp. M1409]|uniref:hypothetical protein n=1 Tax=unclassified Mesorhizobium TaxID=325217 RepID=UPI00333BCE51